MNKSLDGLLALCIGVMVICVLSIAGLALQNYQYKEAVIGITGKAIVDIRNIGNTINKEVGNMVSDIYNQFIILRDKMDKLDKNDNWLIMENKILKLKISEMDARLKTLECEGR